MPPTTTSSPRPFRVIIVGGGPAGLCLAHALAGTGIDYVLLERRDTVVQSSALGLALWPHTVRILDQLGLFEEAMGIRVLLKEKYNYLPDGAEICHTDLYDDIEQKTLCLQALALTHLPVSREQPWPRLDPLQATGAPRSPLCRLPENDTRILHNKNVVAVERLPDDAGVRVRWEDGDAIKGSIVVGCDGVHSQVRGLMRELALAASVNLGNAARPMVAHYQVLAGRMRRIPHLPAKRLWEVRAYQANMHLFMLENDGWAEAFGNGFADCPVTKELTFRDFWAQREWVALFNVEEGFLTTWHWDRIVLLGDAVHKMTPNAGLALNAGRQGVLALTNGLSRLFATNPTPNAAALGEYQTKTVKRAKQSFWLSQMYIRITSWDNLMWEIADYLGPYLGGDTTLFKRLAAPIVKDCMILDNRPEPNFKEGKIPWVNRPHTDRKRKSARSLEEC